MLWWNVPPAWPSCEHLRRRARREPEQRRVAHTAETERLLAKITPLNKAKVILQAPQTSREPIGAYELPRQRLDQPPKQDGG